VKELWMIKTMINYNTQSEVTVTKTDQHRKSIAR